MLAKKKTRAEIFIFFFGSEKVPSEKQIREQKNKKTRTRMTQSAVECFAAMSLLNQQRNDAEQAMKEARERDLATIREEAVLAGFSSSQLKTRLAKPHITIYTFHGRLEVTTSSNAWGFFKRSLQGNSSVLSDNAIERLGWTAPQVHFLEWEITLERILERFWQGDTPFATIEELIANQKQTCKKMYALAPKRALSSSGGASTEEEEQDAQSNTKRARED